MKTEFLKSIRFMIGLCMCMFKEHDKFTILAMFGYPVVKFTAMVQPSPCILRAFSSFLTETIFVSCQAVPVWFTSTGSTGPAVSLCTS